MNKLLAKIHATDKNLRDFGVLMAIVCGAIAAYMFWKGRGSIWIPGLGAIFFVTAAFFLRQVLKPFYFAWMALALVLGAVMSRIILAILFFAVITPISILRRLFGADPLNLAFDEKSVTYWHVRDGKVPPPEHYERMY